MLTWKRSTNGLINEKCILTLIQINKQMNLFFLGSLFLITYLIFQSFIIDYGDTLYYKPNNKNFQNKIEKL